MVDLIAALLALGFGLFLILAAYRPPEVAAGFTRVGGKTRVETAAYAAAFWLTAPKTVVETLAIEPGAVMLAAAQCAISRDAPLLFIRQQGPNAVVQDLLGRWRPAPKVWMVTSQKASCSQYEARGSPSGCPSVPRGLHTLTENADEHVLPSPPSPRICARDTLEEFVVFAASADPSVAPSGTAGQADLPDVAVGLALAAHIALTRDVSFVVVPRYLEADPELEEELRTDHHPVLGGLLLGGEDRISEDTRILLREILQARDVPGIVVAIHGALGDFGTLVAALVALAVGVGGTAREAPLVARELRNGGHQLKSVPRRATNVFLEFKRRSTEMLDKWKHRSQGEGQAVHSADVTSVASRDEPSPAQAIIATFADRDVVIHLETLDRVTGHLDGEAKQQHARWIAISDASVWRASTQDEVRSPRALVSVDAIAFVAEPSDPGANLPPAVSGTIGDGPPETDG
jgi:hypothetical protein